MILCCPCSIFPSDLHGHSHPTLRSTESPSSSLPSSFAKNRAIFTIVELVHKTCWHIEPHQNGEKLWKDVSFLFTTGQSPLPAGVTRTGIYSPMTGSATPIAPNGKEKTSCFTLDKVSSLYPILLSTTPQPWCSYALPRQTHSLESYAIH